MGFTDNGAEAPTQKGSAGPGSGGACPGVKTSVDGGIRTRADDPWEAYHEAAREADRRSRAADAALRAAAYRHARAAEHKHPRASAKKPAKGRAKHDRDAGGASETRFKFPGKSFFLPLIIIIGGIALILMMVNAGGAGVGSIFSGTMGTVDADGNITEFAISEFITNPEWGIPFLRASTISDILDIAAYAEISNGGSFHIVRLYVAGSDEPVELTTDAIDREFIGVFPLAEIIQPIFNAVILMDYDLQPTHSQAVDLLYEMYSELFSISGEATAEWCGHSVYDGTGTELQQCAACSAIHAVTSGVNACPNIISGFHPLFVCNPSMNGCCRYRCGGHGHTETCPTDPVTGALICTSPHTCTRANSVTNPCPFRFFSACNGYRHCGGHDVLSIYVRGDGLPVLMRKYFTDPINALLAISPRSEDEEMRLQNLISFEELTLELINLADFGFGFRSASWAEVEQAMVNFLPSSRPGKWAVVERARYYLGATRGDLGVNFEWCAWFVNKCFVESGLKPMYGSSANDNRCTIRMEYAKSLGRWVDAPYYDLAPGDVIFFRGESAATSGHVEIVIGRDAEYVYTIGRRGDKVGIRVIALDHPYIKGYEIF